MNNLLLMLVVLITLACQVTANTIIGSLEYTVVSAMLAEPYFAVLLSLLALIATLIWTFLINQFIYYHFKIPSRLFSLYLVRLGIGKNMYEN